MELQPLQNDEGVVIEIKQGESQGIGRIRELLVHNCRVSRQHVQAEALPGQQLALIPQKAVYVVRAGQPLTSAVACLERVQVINWGWGQRLTGGRPCAARIAFQAP